MPFRFDAGLKGLAAIHPRDFVVTFAGDPTETVRMLNPDLSTVTTSADAVFGIGEPLERIVHACRRRKDWHMLSTD